MSSVGTSPARSSGPTQPARIFRRYVLAPPSPPSPPHVLLPPFCQSGALKLLIIARSHYCTAVSLDDNARRPAGASQRRAATRRASAWPALGSPGTSPSPVCQSDGSSSRPCSLALCSTLGSAMPTTPRFTVRPPAPRTPFTRAHEKSFPRGASMQQHSANWPFQLV